MPLKSFFRLALACSLLLVPIVGVFSPSRCKGKLERVKIDFEVDRDGNPLSVGDTPFLLPENITVTGYRRDGNGGQRGRNDLALRFPGGRHKHVLIIDEDDNKTTSRWNRNGGTVIFKFDKPVYQVNQVEFINKSPNRHNRPDTILQARSKGSSERRTVTLSNDADTSVVRLLDWFNVRDLRVSTFVPGAIASFDVTICRYPCFHDSRELRDIARNVFYGNDNRHLRRYGPMEKWCFTPALTDMSNLFRGCLLYTSPSPRD